MINGGLDISPIITHCLPLEDAEKGWSFWIRKQRMRAKFWFTYDLKDRSNKWWIIFRQT